MPPEQAQGHLREIGVCSDVYVLGAIFYELLTNRPIGLLERNLAWCRRNPLAAGALGIFLLVTLGCGAVGMSFLAWTRWRRKRGPARRKSL